ncbi:MAG TPA: amino acid adenylation domain-containing protein, partial [Pyrinomonadaceae bacterium]
LSGRLRELSRAQGATLYMVLLAAFKVLLYRWTGQEDILVGTPIAGRTRRETEELIGFFVNTLVLRTQVSGELSFQELVGRVREATLGAFTHQDVPFEKLVEELQPERDLSRTPLFQVFFNMHNFSDQRMELPGLELQPLKPSHLTSNFDLTLYVQERAEEIHLQLVYDKALFFPARMAELLNQLNQLLSQVALNPNESIARYSLVTTESRAILPDPSEILSDRWEGAVHTLFAAQAARAPGRLAVKDARDIWTYTELDERSNQLAHYLREQEIQNEDIVAIYAHRNASLVWAVLGTLKAGAAFLVLDPAYPISRLLDYLEMAKPRALIRLEAAGELPTALEEFVAASDVRCRLDLPALTDAAASGFLAQHSPAMPNVAVGADDLAYISFTSGSTGRPKAIMGRHGPLSHFLPWQRETFGLVESDRYSMLSGLSHDPLHRDIFTPLAFGAAIVVPDPEQTGMAGQLAAWMKQERINVAHLTPAMVQLLVQTAPDADSSALEVPTLRYAFTVGDVLTRLDVHRLRQLAPHITCVNYYGSTETQRAVGYYVVPRDETPDASAPEGGDTANRAKEIIPLGRGMKDVQLLVLNDSRQQAGISETGEIYIRSPHLARGYMDDDALSRARFIPNPFTLDTNVSGDRLYRTGDLGVYLPDGNVEFRGRNDLQVKIRGFRIELGEIEATLARHPSVQNTVVVAREFAPGDRRLAAYLVPNPECVIKTDELRQFLKDLLPDYMIPAAFIPLTALPVTPNGKIDRQALPAPASYEGVRGGEFVAPRNAVEESLAGMWAEVLSLPRVGVHDNFFELGGHSLLATQINSRVRDAFQVELPLRRLFEMPTVAELAATIILVQLEQEEETQRLLRMIEQLSDHEVSAELSRRQEKEAQHP